jgi:RNA-directed DNA polymerase
LGVHTSQHEFIARQLAATLLAGDWTRRALAERMSRLLGTTTLKSQQRLLGHVLAKPRATYPPAPAELVMCLLAAGSFKRAVRPLFRRETPVHAVLQSPQFAPVAPFHGLDIPQLEAPGDVARWLGVPIDQLDWFSDHIRQHERTAIPILQHYTYAFVPKRVGPPRLIEAPKPRLVTIQRRILRDILDRVPTHDAAHGFVAGRSCLTGAVVHVGAAMVVTVDLADFFLMTPLGRVHALFRSLGYPWAVARCLTGLCSTATPRSVFDHLPAPRRHTAAALRAYRGQHLPQGAPTSPALANLVAWRLDVRLSGLATAFGATYTRYADDLAFSGDDLFARKTDSLLVAIETIAEDEGYALNQRKTRIMRSAARQRVTGVVVNDHLNVPRETFETLKATLHNCRKLGPASQNRDGHADFKAHLDGRIGWVESLNPARGQRLRAIYHQVVWEM